MFARFEYFGTSVNFLMGLDEETQELNLDEILNLLEEIQIKKYNEFSYLISERYDGYASFEDYLEAPDDEKQSELNKTRKKQKEILLSGSHLEIIKILKILDQHTGNTTLSSFSEFVTDIRNVTSYIEDSRDRILKENYDPYYL